MPKAMPTSLGIVIETYPETGIAYVLLKLIV
jgi:hypothetical protein